MTETNALDPEIMDHTKNSESLFNTGLILTTNIKFYKHIIIICIKLF